MSNIYFTVNVNKAGFTDQLSQFSVYYTLGKYLGFEYVHTRIKTYRSSPVIYSKYVFISKLFNLFHIIKRFFNLNNELFDNIGINSHFKNNLLKRNEYKSIVEIKFDEEFITNNNIRGLEDLKAYILTLAEKINGNDNKKLLIKFIHITGMKQTWWIKNVLPPARNYLDLYKIYKHSRSANSIMSLYSKNNEIKILVHIRQGDIGIVKTPWDTYIPILRKRSARLIEYDSIKEINKKFKSMSHPSEFLNYLSAFCEHFAGNKFSILIFSDGYSRSLDMIIRNINKLNLDRDKKTLLIKSFKDYDNNQFKAFERVENSRCIIGESEIKLQQLVQSVTEADIVICSEQQYMIQKLTASICKKDKPAVIILKKDSESMIEDYFFNEKRFIYEQLENPDYEKVGKVLNLN